MPSRTIVAVAQKDPATGRVLLDKDGKPLGTKFVIDPVKRYIRPYWLTSSPLELVLAAQGSPGDNDIIEFEVDQQGHFDWNSIIGTGTDLFAMEFFDTATNRNLQNHPVISNTVIGSAERPFFLPEPYFVNVGDSRRTIRVRVYNLSAAQITVRVVLYGRRFYHNEAPADITAKFLAQFGQAERTYSYFLVPKEVKLDGDIDPIAAGATETYQFSSDSEADTVIQKAMVYTDPTMTNFEFTLRERVTNRLIMTAAVDGNHGWGTAEFPFRFADSYLLERQKDLFLEVKNLSGVSARFFFTMAGLRVHYDPFA